jgi:hypothetical protein
MGEAFSLSANIELETMWWLHGELMDDVDYFVVMAGCYIRYCLSYICMFSIGCKPIYC